MTNELKGGCLCGAVRFSASPTAAKMFVCHCSMCRRWSGGTFMAVNCGDRVVFENDSELGVYRSSKRGERTFCKSCGSTLMWRTPDGKYCSVSAQAFDDSSVFQFSSEIFIDEKPGNYAFANETDKMTGAEVFAKFAQ